MRTIISLRGREGGFRAGDLHRLAQRLESNARAKLWCPGEGGLAEQSVVGGLASRVARGTRRLTLDLQIGREIGALWRVLHRWDGLEGGLHLFSARDCEIPETSKPQRRGRGNASPRPGCKLRESRRLWTAGKKWRGIMQR